MMSMRMKTTILIILIVFATTSSTFFSGLYFTNNSLEKTIEQDLKFAIGIADSLVSTQMKLMKTEAATVAVRLEAAGAPGELARLLVEQFNAYPEISSLTVFDRGGVIATYSVPAHEHDLHEHDGYMYRVYNGDAILTSPFYCSALGEFVLNIYTPMSAGRILAVTMPGLTFSDMLANHRLWQSGDIFMLNEVGTFIGAADEEIVLAMGNYVTGNKDKADEGGEEASDLIQKILSSDNGVEYYNVAGVERLCAYSRIDASSLGWRVAVTVPTGESPQSDALAGQAYAAVFFLLIGAVAAFFLSKLIEQPFNRIEAQNRDLERLNETIRSQADAILEEHERVQLMLDATPLACRLWSRNFELLEGNEAAVKLFGLKDKQEYIDRYFELSPDYQLDGQTTRAKVEEIVSEAFEKGECTHEWLYRMPNGEPLPCEITLVRVPYGDDYAVASYSRDLREQKKMIAEIEHRDKLLGTACQVSFTLFDTDADKDIEAVLADSMELLGQCVSVDQVYITQNEMVDGVPHFTCKSAWSGAGGIQSAIAPGMTFPWGLDLDWDSRFRQGECMNGPVKDMPERIQKFFAPFTARSVLVIPVFVQEKFWGLVGFSDCRRDRSFVADEVDILRSTSLMMAAAANRNEQAVRIREAHNRIRLLTNATPLGFNLWDRDFKNIETNDTAVSLFGLTSQQEYLRRFFDLSPEYQPDGRPSKAAIFENLNTAFEKGYLQVEWLHQELDGTPVPSEVTLVRLTYGDGHVVAGYIRDLREYKKMIAEIDLRDYLRNITNQVADILLRSEPDNFSQTLYQCMGMMTQAIKADRMYIGKNQNEGGKLYRTLLYEWPGADSPDTGAAEPVFYDEGTLSVKETLLRGECVNMLVRDMADADRRRLGSQGVLAVLLVPVFIRDELWGFVGFNNCHSEQLFTENDASVMRSGSMLVVNALLRNEDMLRIRDTSSRLETALADAERANNAKSDFLAQMSHEIRTPLNAVIGLSELMIGEERMSREAESNLEKIYGAGVTILSIVNDILDISKIESGKFELNPIRYDTPSLINDTVTLNVVRIGEKPITFKVCVDENLPGSLYGDDLRVKQIFNNLLSNAFKYTHTGTVEWRISFERDGDDIWLVSSVRDTGVGIKPADLEKLFADYHQIDTKANRRVEGTGLGLAITRRLVEMTGGAITVESEYGKGSVFHVRLRQTVASDAPIGPEVAKNLMDLRYTLSRHGKNNKLTRMDLSWAHVLVVDDIETNLDVVKGMMKPYGMKIDCATSGRQAIEMIRREEPRYSAVFMDHMMPGMDGIEAACIIREELGTDYARNIPIIALTANAIVGNEEMFLHQGFQAFISKPIDTTKLDFVLRQWIRDKQPGYKGADGDNALPGEGKRGSVLAGIKIGGLDVSRALERFGGDEAILIDILRSYATNTPRLLRSLREYMRAGQMEDYAIVVHGIKGSSYGILAQEAGKAAETLETAAKDGNIDAVKAGHPAFAKLTEDLLRDIQNALAVFDSAADKPLAAKPDPALLQEIRAACQAFDMDRVDAAMQRLESLRYKQGEALVAWLREQVNNMAFEEIAGDEWPSL